MRINFTVYANPVAQGRPRFARVGKYVRTYDPKKSAGWKDTVRWQAIQNKVPMLKGALALKMVFHLPRPKSLPKKVRYPIKKPDWKNLASGTEDALHGICFENDSQVIQAQVLKVYCKDGERPGVDIEIWEVDE